MFFIHVLFLLSLAPFITVYLSPIYIVTLYCWDSSYMA